MLKSPRLYPVFLILLLIGAAILLAAFAPGSSSLTLGPYSAAMNFTADMAGTPDQRPGTWGSAQAYPIRIPFHPPTGYRTRILRVRGDFTSFPLTDAAHPEIPRGTYSEVSWGFLTTAPSGSSRGEFIADDCFLWNQDVLTNHHDVSRMPVNYAVENGGLLEADNILILQVAVSLNTTGLTIHEEPTLVAEYQFEKVP